MSIYGEWAVAMGSFGHAAMKEKGRKREREAQDASNAHVYGFAVFRST